MAIATTDERAAADGPPPPADPRGASGRRVRVGELLSAAGALALLVVMFTTEWYGVAGVPDPSYARPAVSTAENGWEALADVRWLLLVTIVVALGSVVVRFSQRDHGVQTDTGPIVLGLGALSAALLVYRVLISFPAGGRVIDQKLGALLGLACALVIAWGGWELIGEQRAHAAQSGVRHRRRSRLTRNRSAVGDPDGAPAAVTARRYSARGAAGGTSAPDR